jgi:PAS domain S-box-containing protein
MPRALGKDFLSPATMGLATIPGRAYARYTVASERASDDRLWDILSTAPVPVQLVGPDGTIVGANQTALAMLGYRREEYVGRPVAECHIDPSAGADLAGRLSRGEPLRDYEARVRAADGSGRHVLITSDVRWDGERVRLTCCFIRDVTEAKVAERRLAVQYRVAQILAAETDPTEGLRRALLAVCEELGWDVGEVWRRDADIDALRLVVSVERPGVDADALTLLGREAPLAHGVGLPGHVWVTGTPVWLDEIAKAPMFERAAAAEVAGLRTACGIPIALGDDVSILIALRREPERGDEATLRTLRLVARQIEQFLERARTAQERQDLLERERQARLDAEAANRAKDEFLAGVSHELRTPLNAILGWSRLLHGGDLDADTVARGLAAIERNAAVQAQLIADLLDVARIVTGKIQLELEPTDLAVVMEAALDAVRPIAVAKGLWLEARIAQPVPPTLGDADRLQQVVWNLLTNAIRFTPKGGRVTASLRVRDARAIIQIVDEGIGIDAQFLPYVFDRFRQAETGTTRRQGGLGLGLSIVRHLTELHGGDVRAESAGEGQGATFTVELPLIAPAATAARPLAALPPGEAPVSLRGIRVLLVDDDRDARDLLGMVLRLHEATVSEAGSADDAIVVFQRAGADVVVSDIGLPAEDGYGLLRRLRALDTPAAKGVIAVALTGWARAEDRDAALAAGFQAHVAKPVDPHQLVELLARLAREAGLSMVVGTDLAIP